MICYDSLVGGWVSGQRLGLDGGGGGEEQADNKFASRA
jgi:hypothetical protein